MLIRRTFEIVQNVVRTALTHLSGKSNGATDATSRYPSSSFASNVCLDLLTEQDNVENALNAAISLATKQLTSLSWHEISKETSSDPTLSKLIAYLRAGFPPDRISLDDALKPFWNIRQFLYLTDEDVLMYDGRVIIPSSLRDRVLKLLHSAHQGTSSMHLGAQTLLFWPGMNKDIRKVGDECFDCCRNAPSQPAPLAVANPDIPAMPFES